MRRVLIGLMIVLACLGSGYGQKTQPATEPERQVTYVLAGMAFNPMLDAYTTRADKEALTQGEELLRLYPDIVKKQYLQTEAILAELKRRKQKGTFGKDSSANRPKDFDTWESKKKIAWLIDALDEVDVRPWCTPGSPVLGADRRVDDLVKIGDPAVPALIDTVEKDERLTRSANDDRVLGVRDAALSAVLSIFKVHVLEPASTGGNFTCQSPEETATTVKQLRQYWRVYGGMPFEERMMKLLANSKASCEARREGAHNLARLREGRTWAGWGFMDSVDIPIPRPRPENSAVAKFSKPTVAEAILTAMDSDPSGEDNYLTPLVELGDKRITGELVRRFRTATDDRLRRKVALACCSLGDPGPINVFAGEVENGSLKLPPDDPQPSTADNRAPPTGLTGMIAALVYAKTVKCDRALLALAAPTHPYHAAVVKEVLRACEGFPDDDNPCLAHPFCLAILRNPLDDTSLTGSDWCIGENNLERHSEHAFSYQTIPESLQDPAARRDHAVERKCDQVAIMLGDLILGLPEYNPLLKDSDARLAEIKRALDRFRGRFRNLSQAESNSLDTSLGYTKFVPDIRPLDHAATADDVANGFAVFHLDGKGKRAEVKLPAVATLRAGKHSKRSPPVIVVQAEVGQDGKTTYGIIGGGDIRAAAADELEGIKPIVETNGGKGK